MDSSGDEGATGYDRYREMLIENLELKGENDRIKSELDKVKKDLENKDSGRFWKSLFHFEDFSPKRVSIESIVVIESLY